MTQTDKMLSRKEGGVGYLIFNNPERHNAVSLEMWDAASGILADFAADNAVRVVVLTGAGGKAFVSGADISKFESERSSKDAIDRYNAAVDQANTAVYEFPKPTIATVVVSASHCAATCASVRTIPNSVCLRRNSVSATVSRASRSWWMWSVRPSPRRSFSQRVSSLRRKRCRWAWSTVRCPTRRSRNM